jgi:hypothetical protein
LVPQRLAKSRRKFLSSGGFSRRIVTGALAAVGVLGVLVSMVVAVQPAPAVAATGINKQINFQGKLVNTNGTNIPDGTYNMEFKLYTGGTGCVSSGSAPCGGSLQWTETRLRTASQGVTVSAGIFQVNLGSVNSLPAVFNNDDLWLSINLGTTNATCTPFSSCGGDGEMTTRKTPGWVSARQRRPIRWTWSATSTRRRATGSGESRVRRRQPVAPVTTP